jgi:hypothetical protein
MRPKEFIAKLDELGLQVTRRTIINWENWGLISPAIERTGKTTIYPDNIFAEAYANEALRKRKSKYKLTKDAVSEIRKIALDAESENNIQDLLQGFVSIERELAYKWLVYKFNAMQGVRLDEALAQERNTAKGDDELTAQIASRY